VSGETTDISICSVVTSRRTTGICGDRQQTNHRIFFDIVSDVPRFAIRGILKHPGNLFYRGHSDRDLFPVQEIKNETEGCGKGRKMIPGVPFI